MSDQNDLENIKESPFLATKLFIPRSNAKLIVRSSLIEKLNSFYDPFHDHKMTLVSAPAGYGKTTILTQWITHFNNPVAWLSLDEKDNDPFIFLQYLIAALQSVDATLGVSAANLLQTAKKQSLTAILIPLLNDISVNQKKISVILDDYHYIQAREVHEILRYIFDHMPPQLHLILSTRADPPLPLAKMRARNTLSEIRLRELCFTRQDINSFFSTTMELNLSEQDITALEHRTEGWAAGLQLAAISLKGCENIQEFIEAFAGDNRYIVDYLVEEVLSNQDERTHDFLVRTSLLEHMSAELCDYVLGRDDSQAMLENLEQQNLFIVPLDDRRSWFRYHHLFADLLFQRLRRTGDATVSKLRKRASEWHEGRRYLDSAIDYAILAEDYPRAVKLFELVLDSDWEHGKRTKLHKWFEKIPVEYLHDNLELCLLYAWVLLDDNKQEKAEKSLASVEILLKQQDTYADDTGFSQDAYFNEIRGRTKVLRALIEYGRGNIQRILDYSEEALHWLREDSLTWRANSLFARGIAFSYKGDLDSAVDAYSQSMSLSKKAGNLDLYFRASYWLVARLSFAARLDKATQTCDELFEVIRENRLEQSLIAAGVHVSWGNILYERNQLDDALNHIEKNLNIIETSHDIGHKAWCYFCMMRVLIAKDEIEAAESLVGKLEHLKATTELPYSFFLLTEACKAQFWLSRGRLDRVERWLKENNFSPAEEITAYRDVGQIILARYLFARGHIDDAKFLLKNLITGQEKLGRTILRIESLLVQARVLANEGDKKGADTAISRALHLAEKGDCVRVFINEGKLVAEMIENLLLDKNGVSRPFAQKLLAGFKISEVREGEKKDKEELLSERELEILRLIAAGLSNKKIMEKLYISLSTVKTHLRNIYSKLDAHSRTEAVAKANELDLL